MSGPPLLHDPGSLGLPLLDHGEQGSARTLQAARERWPHIEALVAQGSTAAAIDALETLAGEMRALTPGDAEAWRDTLEAARLCVYEDLALLGAAAALERCQASDPELRGEIAARLGTLRRRMTECSE